MTSAYTEKHHGGCTFLTIPVNCLLFVSMLTKKHHSKNAPLSKALRERLEDLRQESGMNYTAFAAAAGVPRAQYNAWRNSGVVPGGHYLVQMAQRLGVTVDWLLGMDSAPKRPNQWRTDTSLAEDVAGYVATAIALRVRGTQVEPLLRDLVPDGTAFLEHGIAREVENLTNAAHAANSVVAAQRRAALNAVRTSQLIDGTQRPRHRQTHAQWIEEQRTASHHAELAASSASERERETLFWGQLAKSALVHWVSASIKKRGHVDLSDASLVPAVFHDPKNDGGVTRHEAGKATGAAGKRGVKGQQTSAVRSQRIDQRPKKRSRRTKG